MSSDMKNILFITKDALNRSYLPTYGNKLWSTPNIAELASKGTVFRNHHTGAPSTMMSNMCMFTSMNPFESELSDYVFSNIHFKGNTLWTEAEKRGYSCHIIWDEAWDSQFRMRERYYCYGENSIIHSLPNIRQGVGAHHKHEGFLEQDDSKFNDALVRLSREVDSIVNNSSNPVLLWIHIPHVINGYTGYGSDIEAFDKIIGMCRQYFSDDEIFISADHGNMNAEKGKFSYGHDVYEASTLIPLISPKILNKDYVDVLTSNIDIKEILLDRIISERKFIYSDSAFYMQMNRKLAIYYKSFKYIYNKLGNTEELYDLSYDPRENCNLIDDYFYDIDRCDKAPIRELYFYPRWDILPEVRSVLRNERLRIWKEGSRKQKLYESMKEFLRNNMFTRKLFIKFAPTIKYYIVKIWG